MYITLEGKLLIAFNFDYLPLWKLFKRVQINIYFILYIYLYKYLFDVTINYDIICSIF